jgi:hypothetical protein
MKKIIFVLITFAISIGFSLQKAPDLYRGKSPQISLILEKDTQDIADLLFDIDFESFYGKPIDSLFARYPILDSYVILFPDLEPSFCLHGYDFYFKSKKVKNLYLSIVCGKKKYLQDCFGGNDVFAANDKRILAVFKKEVLEKVKLKTNDALRTVETKNTYISAKANDTGQLFNALLNENFSAYIGKPIDTLFAHYPELNNYKIYGNCFYSPTKNSHKYNFFYSNKKIPFIRISLMCADDLQFLKNNVPKTEAEAQSQSVLSLFRKESLKGGDFFISKYLDGWDSLVFRK